MSSLLTMGEVARLLSVPVHKVRYICQTRNVKTERVGQSRVFDPATVEMIRQEIQRISGRSLAAV